MLLLLICLLVILTVAVVGLIFHISPAHDIIYVMFCLLLLQDPGPGFRRAASIKAEKESREGGAPKIVRLEMCLEREKKNSECDPSISWRDRKEKVRKMKLKSIIKEKKNLEMSLGFSLNSKCWRHLSSLFRKSTISSYLCQVLLSINRGNLSWACSGSYNWACAECPRKAFCYILLGKWSEKVSTRQPHASRITADISQPKDTHLQQHKAATTPCLTGIIFPAHTAKGLWGYFWVLVPDRDQPSKNWLQNKRDS